MVTVPFAIKYCVDVPPALIIEVPVTDPVATKFPVLDKVALGLVPPSPKFNTLEESVYIA